MASSSRTNQVKAEDGDKLKKIVDVEFEVLKKQRKGYLAKDLTAKQ
jgi:hypothetical protein